MSYRRSRLDFKVHGLRPDPCSSPVIEGFRRQDVDGLAALVECKKEVYIRIGTGIAPRGRSEESDTPHTEILERGCDAPYEGCRFGYSGLIEVLKEVNSEIRDEDYHLGISFFLTAELPEHIEDIWRMEIYPYLEECFFDQRDKLSRFRWDAIKGRVAV
jgi:hypothetical protein